MSEKPDAAPTTALVPAPMPFTAAMQPKDLPQLVRFCQMLSQSSICPKALKGDTMAVMVAIQAGERHGFDVLGSIQNIAVINGKPSFYGDAMLGICRASPMFGGIKETHGGEWEKGDAWGECKVWRKGEEKHPTVQRFTYAMAKRAKLVGKPGPWTDYPERMLMFRARGWALRDCFPDLLSGIISAEEAMDYPTTVDAHGNPTERVSGPVIDASTMQEAPQGTAVNDVLMDIATAQSLEELLGPVVATIQEAGLGKDPQVADEFVRRRKALWNSRRPQLDTAPLEEVEAGVRG